jgi:lipopolysaccharide transport system ATP-binding protein
MSRLSISVNALSKKYQIKQRLSTLKSSQAYLYARKIKRKLINGEDVEKALELNSDFYALNEVSFQIQQGESVGIIGRNGAGKSTLLKVLSRIIKPTSGTVDIHGRVSALLEVGTGFHPELTGRENIFMNAAIHGLSNKEVSSRFDEIVDFSGVEEFLEMPIKHYSSGMFMRLAFAVSANLDSDILILDEVLAVGDAAFQKKCLKKIDDVAGDGRTVLFVSHSLPSVISFCDRAILLDRGRLIQDGKTSEVVESYQKMVAEEAYLEEEVIEAKNNLTKKAIFSSIKLRSIDRNGVKKSIFSVGDNLEIKTTLTANEKIIENNVAVVIYDENNYRLIDVNLALKNDHLSLNAGEVANITFILKNLLLRPGSYRIGLWAGRRAIEDSDLIANAARLNVEIDPQSIRHFYIYDGPYQCAFEHTIERS